MKTVGNVLFFAGFLIAGIGIGLPKVDLLLAVKMMMSGFAVASIGYLLSIWFVKVSEYEF